MDYHRAVEVMLDLRELAEREEEMDRFERRFDNQCGDPDNDICGNYFAPEYPDGPEDCPQGSTYTVVDCEPQCIERDSCELFDDAP